MSEINKKAADRVIREIVEAEEKAALDRFRSSHFQERLEQRMKSSSLRPQRPSIFRVVPRPVWVSLLFLIVLGGALLTFRFLATQEHTAGGSVENWLRQLDGIQAIERESRTVSSLSSAAPSLKNGIASVLFSPEGQSRATPLPQPGSGFSAINPKAEPMNLEEFYGLLIMNQSVERVLTAISQKTKEG